MTVLIEACVDAIDAAVEAERGGAGRLELCGELLQGGVTPSAGLIGAVRERVKIPLFVLIRPRTGDFLYSADERDVMLRDIALARSFGADGVVIGALTSIGDVDMETTRALIDAARPMQVTFHRAFDFARDQGAAMDALLSVGVDRVLTSGGAASALEGAAALRAMVHLAGDAMTILAGGSITASNVADVVRESGVRQVHLRAAVRVESAMTHRRGNVTLARPQAPNDYERVVASADEIRRVMAALS
ncbi:MAG: Copper homeostasis protein cutC [Gemmatimonadetes bacterium]|nr:Copper homeostasis protein cutC [Gemmatimonadota bacterium]